MIKIKFLRAFVAVLTTLLFCQLPALCYDVTGTWYSNWGPVHITNNGYSSDGSLKIKGYWNQTDGGVGQIKKGGYHASRNLLWFDYVKEGIKGRAEFWLQNDGTTFSGTFTEPNETGHWTLTRSRVATGKGKKGGGKNRANKAYKEQKRWKKKNQRTR